MKTFKKVLSVVLALTMVLGTMTFTGVSAADAYTIYEDFGTGFVIGESEITTTAAGLTVTAHADVLANAKFATSDAGLYVPGGGTSNTADGLESSGDKKGVNFAFDPITEGTAEISFDLTIVNAGYSHPSALGKLISVAEDGTETSVIGNYFWTATVTASATTGETAGNGLYYGGGQYDGSIKVASDVNEKVRITYAMDFTEQTVDVIVNGESIATANMKNGVANVSKMTFDDDYNCASYIIDNLTVVSDATAAQKTITFEGADVEPITTTYGRLVTLPVPDVDGMIFNGWTTEDGEEVANSIIVTDDMNLTADLRDKVAISEKFGDDFILDVDNKTVSTNSGLTVTAGDAFYALNPTADGALYAKAYTNGNGVTGDMSMTFEFPEIRKGKVKLAFDLAIPCTGFTNWFAVYGKPYFTAGNSETGKNAIALYTRGMNGAGTKETTVYLATANASDGQSTNTIGTITQSSELANIEYIIDLDAKTYSVTWGGQTYSDIAFVSEDATSIDNFTIAFAEDGVRNKNCDIMIDNLTVVEDPENNNFTITFMNGEEVYNEQIVTFGGKVTVPENPFANGKAFCGWATTEDGEALTETEITALTTDTVLYATFRDVLNITEDFGENFSIDYDAKTMTSNSGLTFASSKEGTWDTSYGIQAGANGISVPHSQANIPMADVMIKFPSIASGKVYISFDLTNLHSSTGHLQNRFALGIGDSSTSTWATYLTAADITYYATEDETQVPEGTIEYVIDLDNGTYTIKAGGTLLGGTHELASTNALDCIYLTTGELGGWYSAPFSFDNLVIKEDPTGEGSKVTYMNGNEEYATATVSFGVIDAVPANPSVDGKAFLGWATADGEIIDADYYLTVVADTVLYATFRNNLNMVEDFEDGFALIPATLETNEEGTYTGNVTTAGSITTDSGFTFSAETTNAYGALSVTAANGSNALYNNGYIGLNAKLSDIYMDFPAIYSGKIYIAFDLRIPHVGQVNDAFQNQIFFGIGNAAEGNAVKLIKAYNEETVTVDGVDTVKKTTKVTTEAGTAVAYQPTSDYYTYEYVIDLDNGTYSLEVSDTNGAAATLTDVALGAEISYIDRIALPQFADQNTWYNTPWYIDNVTLVENYTGTVTPPVEPTTYTVTFYDEDGVTVLGTATVNEGETAVYTGSTPVKAATAQYTYTFAGWDGSLENITADTTVKATYTSTVNKYKVTFVDHDGTVLKEEDVEYGGNATAPADPTRDGYTFTGWDGTYTNVVATVTVTATYEENAVSENTVPESFLNTTIEPMSNEEFNAIMSMDIPEGLYAWKVSHSISDLALSKSGNAMVGYSGTMLDSIEIDIEFGTDGDASDAIFYYAQPITGESALAAGGNYGYGEVNGIYAYRTWWQSAFEPAVAYPTTVSTVDGVENAFVTLLVTKTDSFEFTLMSQYMTTTYTNSDYELEDQVYYWDTTELCDFHENLNKTDCRLIENNPQTVSVVDGVVGGGSEEEVAPLTYADGKVYVNSPEDGMLYIFKKDTDGIVTSQKAYSVTAGTAADYDFAADETAYLWSTVLDPICDPFTITE